MPVGVKCRQMLLRYIYRYRFRAHSVNGSPISAVGSALVPNALLFLSRYGEELTDTAVCRMFVKMRKRLNIPRLHAHLIRHTFATNYLLAGLGDVYQLAQLLGHEAVSTTEIYLHAARYYEIIRKGGHLSYADRSIFPFPSN